MQYPLASCQPEAPYTGRVVQKSTRKKGWAPDPAETVAHTQSRHSGPRAWRCALERAVTAGLLPGFNATTQKIIEVLASRMNFDTGHARYVMQDIMKRTGLGKTAVTGHVKMLRRKGWLAWFEHGSLRNALTAAQRMAMRALKRPEYARTATVYAATIPPAYDVLMGHIVIGSGYSARIIVDHRPLTLVDSVVDNAVDTSGTEAVENSSSSKARTPSLTLVKEVGQVQVVGAKDSSTAKAAAAKSSRRKKRKLTITGYKITSERIEQARLMAPRVRPLVNWLQRATLNQLSWVLLDLVARGWSEPRIVLWLQLLGQEVGGRRRRPRFPHRVIAAALLRDDKAAAQRAQTVGPGDEPYVRPVAPNADFQAAREAIRGREEPLIEYPTADQVPADGWDLGLLQETAKADPKLVIAFARHVGRDEAIRVYGTGAIAILDTADLEARTGYRLLTA